MIVAQVVGWSLVGSATSVWLTVQLVEQRWSPANVGRMGLAVLALVCALHMAWTAKKCESGLVYTGSGGVSTGAAHVAPCRTFSPGR